MKNNDKGLLEEIIENKGTIAIISGLLLGVHMAYQYVYINQCRNTSFTLSEKFLGIGLLAYGLYQNSRINR